VQGFGYSPSHVVSSCHPPVEVTLRYVTLFTKGMSRPLSCTPSSGIVNLLVNRLPEFSPCSCSLYSLGTDLTQNTVSPVLLLFAVYCAIA
jgi:hypothetical protein